MEDQKESFDPYHEWLDIPPHDQPPTFYRLLGIDDLETDPEVIDDAAKRRTTFLHQLASGPHRKEVQKLLNEVATARRTLLNADVKDRYDQSLQATDTDDRAVPLIDVSDPGPPGGAGKTVSLSSGTVTRRRKKSWLDDWRFHAVSAAALLAVVVIVVIISHLRAGDRRAAAPREAGSSSTMEEAARRNAMNRNRSTGRSLIAPDSSFRAAGGKSNPKPKPNAPPKSSQATSLVLSESDQTNPPAASSPQLQSLLEPAQEAKTRGRLLTVGEPTAVVDSQKTALDDLNITPEFSPRKRSRSNGKRFVALNLAGNNWMAGMELVQEFNRIDSLRDQFQVTDDDAGRFSIENGKLKIGVARGTETQIVHLRARSIMLRPGESISIESNIRRRLPGKVRVGLMLGKLRLRIDSDNNKLQVRVLNQTLAALAPQQGKPVTLTVILDPERPGSFNWIVRGGNKNVSGCAKLDSLQELAEIPVGIFFSCPNQDFQGDLWIDNLRVGKLTDPPDLRTPMEIPIEAS